MSEVINSDAEAVNYLNKLSNFRLQMLLAQMKSDAEKLSAREHRRILFAVLNELSGGMMIAGSLKNENEKRMAATFRAAFDGIMLKIALDEANKRAKEEVKSIENNANKG